MGLQGSSSHNEDDLDCDLAVRAEQEGDCRIRMRVGTPYKEHRCNVDLDTRDSSGKLESDAVTDHLGIHGSPEIVEHISNRLEALNLE